MEQSYHELNLNSYDVTFYFCCYKIEFSYSGFILIGLLSTNLSSTVEHRPIYHFLDPLSSHAFEDTGPLAAENQMVVEYSAVSVLTVCCVGDTGKLSHW